MTGSGLQQHLPETPDDDVPESVEAAQEPPGRRWLSAATVGPILLLAVMVMAGVGAAIMVTPGPDEEALARPAGADIVVAGGAPLSWDPAAISDGNSAQMLSQVYEGLTVLDAQSRVRPALARSWSVEDGGRRIVFEMRPDASFSDGTPIDAEDVRRSWLRVLDPANPSPLSSLLDDISGAAAFSRGEGRVEDVGIRTSGETMTVEFERPASYFPAVAAVTNLAVVPTSIEQQSLGPREGSDFTASGAYIPISQSATEVQLQSNPAYWGGAPAIERITVITDNGGRSSVDIFEDGAVDWTRISASDASWIRYDHLLGAQLRRTEEMVVDFLGFDTERPPFNDRAARRAVAMAVDWRNLGRGDAQDTTPATSLIPPGIPARSQEDFVLPYDPEQARLELAAAGYPGGDGFPAVALTTYGVGETTAIAAELRRELGIEVTVEQRPFQEHSALLDADTPAMWTLSWSADYPHPHDFLGLLLRSDSRANTGGWSDPAFDALIDQAAATDDVAAQERLYAAAQAIARDEVPLIPLRYGGTWSLSREGLLGGDVTGTGGLRYADLTWQG